MQRYIFFLSFRVNAFRTLYSVTVSWDQDKLNVAQKIVGESLKVWKNAFYRY